MANRRRKAPPSRSADAPSRFAAIVRVSTEKQAERGHSLANQTRKIKATVARLGGTVTRWFRGQEHAVPDEPRMLLDSLLEEAGKNLFDAVIVTDIARWTRDVERNEQATKRLQDCGIRFFVGSTEYHLDNPEEVLMLQVGAVIGQFTARHQSKRSIECRIESALKGRPACGKRPWGRKWDKDEGWTIIPGADLIIQQIAREYLTSSVGFEDLAAKWGISSQVLHKLLVGQRPKGQEQPDPPVAGATWIQRFRLEKAGINEVIETPVPALLDDVTLAAIRDKSEARRTWEHDAPKNQYLLGRKIYDANTPKFHALTGMTSKGRRYYRPYRDRKGRSWQVRADHIEYAVLSALGDALNRREAFVEAVFQGHGSNEQFVADLVSKRVIHEQEADKAQQAIERVVNAIADGTITNEDAKRRVDKARSSLEKHKGEVAAIDAQLEAIPKQAELEAQRQTLRDQLHATLAKAHQRSALSSGVAFDQDTINAIFGGKDPAGRKYGVYVTPHLDGPRRRYSFEAYGRLGNVTGTLWARETEPDAGEYQAVEDTATLAQVAKGVAKDLGIAGETKFVKP